MESIIRRGGVEMELNKEVKKYLLWVEVGGENGDWSCGHEYHTVCEGGDEREVILEFMMQTRLQGFKNRGDGWTVNGRKINMIELPYSFKDNNWKTLQWVNK